MENRYLDTSAEQPLLLTVPGAARLLSVSRDYVYSLMRRGDLPSVKIGRTRRIKRADVEAWLDRQFQEQANE
jgi:excisionase family DNA binding protein